MELGALCESLSVSPAVASLRMSLNEEDASIGGVEDIWECSCPRHPPWRHRCQDPDCGCALRCPTPSRYWSPQQLVTVRVIVQMLHNAVRAIIVSVALDSASEVVCGSTSLRV
jgi:hypothetical protein